MLNILDTFLDQITMYHLVHYVLIGLLGVASILGFFHIISYSPFTIIFSACFLVAICWIANKTLAYVFHAPTGNESLYITALILALILTPMQSVSDIPFFIFVGCIAMLSKYILAIKKKHIFNPAAIAVVIGGFIFHQYASWWVGTVSMFPAVVFCGILIVKKMQRSTLVVGFLFVATAAAIGFGWVDGISVVNSVKSLFLDSAVVFFATIMLTEPLTTPPTKAMQLVYAALVGFLFTPQVHIGSLYATPELGLIAGNIFSYIVSPKMKLILKLKKKRNSDDGIAEFIFSSVGQLNFKPGQYMEWTLPHPHTDSRGNRRYFTLASSPTEKNPQLGVRFYPNGSSFKKALASLPVGGVISAGSLAGEFVLPKTKRQLAFLAGGIGITPFRSIIQYCIDTNNSWDIILLYMNKEKEEIHFKDVFQKAETLGIKTVYLLHDKKVIGPEDMRSNIPDFSERLFYLSGSHIFVKNSQDLLRSLGVASSHIKKDFFPGFV